MIFEVTALDYYLTMLIEKSMVNGRLVIRNFTIVRYRIDIKDNQWIGRKLSIIDNYLIPEG